MLSDPAYSAHATYWEGEGQKLFDAIAAKAGEPGDPGAAAKTALNQAITAAENAKAGVKTSADGSDVATTAEWVSESVMTTFEEAIAGAKAVAAKSDATQEELEAAESTLKAATTAFESAKKPGAKEIVAGEHTLWLVGDSTVCSFTDPCYYPRYGYGTQIGNYLDGTYEVKNLALSGRSSKSYLGESNYATLFNAETGIKQGDTLIIGFGHNDEKAEAARYTNPNGDWQTAGAFAESLWTNYVAKAQAKGAEVILCTPIVRLPEKDTFSNADLHITASKTNGNMHIAIKGNKGKIANNSDGIAMYYLKLPAGTIFEFTAKATLNQIDDNGQVAFGLMARDDMYIDTFDASIKSDYVAAGTLGGANACNSFFRRNGALGGKEGFVNGTTIEVGQSYTLSIVSNSDGYACTFGNEPTQSGGYDFQLTSVDSENIYIGMFAVRNIDVTFSDISLKIIEEDPGGNEPGAVDTTALEAAIRAAEAAADAVEVSVDGSDVLKTDKWVTQAEMKALTDAIAEAKAVAGKAGAAQTEVDAAKDKLTSAIAAFESANKVGAKEEQEEEPVPDTVDKAELQSAVEAAKKAAEAVKTSEKNGSDVSKSAKWVTPDDMETYQKAIEAAEAVVGKEDATADEAADALAALAKATEVFEQAQKSGTKSSSSGFGGSSTSSGSSTSGSTTTTTGQDGSTTTTTTDRDGTKTDGSIAEKVTGLDGTVTETKTKADGNKTETVKAASGDVTVTAITSDGEVIAKVEIPAVVPALDYSFEDVPTGHWAESAINTMAALSVVNGVSEENHVFDMNSNITRGAMAQILFNLSQGRPLRILCKRVEFWYQ